MHPPAYPKLGTAPAPKRAPTFGCGESTCRPIRKAAPYRAPQNATSLISQCCQRGQHMSPYPLQSVHDTGALEIGFAPRPARPKLPTKRYDVAPLLVHQFE